MNRRNAIKAAIAGVAAAVGWKVSRWWWKRPDIVAITPVGIEPPDDFDIHGDPVYMEFRDCHWWGFDSQPNERQGDVITDDDGQAWRVAVDPYRSGGKWILPVRQC